MTFADPRFSHTAKREDCVVDSLRRQVGPGADALLSDHADYAAQQPGRLA